MSSERSVTNSAPHQPREGRAEIGKSGSSVGALKLSSATLLRHLAEVAELSEAEGDFRMAEHLVDVVYHLASRH